MLEVRAAALCSHSCVGTIMLFSVYQFTREKIATTPTHHCLSFNADLGSNSDAPTAPKVSSTFPGPLSLRSSHALISSCSASSSLKGETAASLASPSTRSDLSGTSRSAMFDTVLLNRVQRFGNKGTTVTNVLREVVNSMGSYTEWLHELTRVDVKRVQLRASDIHKVMSLTFQRTESNLSFSLGFSEPVNPAASSSTLRSPRMPP